MSATPENKRFFLQILDDIEHKLNIGDSYNIIRAAGLLRQLLLDSQPLALKLNREFKVLIRFRVKDHSSLFEDMEDNPNIELVAEIAEWHFLTPIITEYTKELKLKEFLEVVVVRYEKHNYTVRDLIQYTSTFLGGIHSYKPKKEDEKAFTEMEIKLNELNLNLISLASICEVVLVAMEPIKKRLT